MHNDQVDVQKLVNMDPALRNRKIEPIQCSFLFSGSGGFDLDKWLTPKQASTMQPATVQAATVIACNVPAPIEIAPAGNAPASNVWNSSLTRKRRKTCSLLYKHWR